MTTLKINTLETAPEGSKKLIETSISKDKPIIVMNNSSQKTGVITQSDLLRAVVEGNDSE